MTRLSGQPSDAFTGAVQTSKHRGYGGRVTVMTHGKVPRPSHLDEEMQLRDVGGRRAESQPAAAAPLSDADLHRTARDQFETAQRAVFADLSPTVVQLIAREIWKTQGFVSFGAYALADVDDGGLGIRNDRQLYLLRCVLDVHGNLAHLVACVTLLVEVDALMKARPVAERGSIAQYNGNSLDTAARACVDQHNARITYWPSRNRNEDGFLVRLRRKPAIFDKIVTGEITLAEARRAAATQKSARLPKRKRASARVKTKQILDQMLEAAEELRKRGGERTVAELVCQRGAGRQEVAETIAYLQCVREAAEQTIDQLQRVQTQYPTPRKQKAAKNNDTSRGRPRGRSLQGRRLAP